MTAGNAESWG